MEADLKKFTVYRAADGMSCDHYPHCKKRWIEVNREGGGSHLTLHDYVREAQNHVDQVEHFERKSDDGQNAREPV